MKFVVEKEANSLPEKTNPLNPRNPWSYKKTDSWFYKKLIHYGQTKLEAVASHRYHDSHGLGHEPDSSELYRMKRVLPMSCGRGQNCFFTARWAEKILFLWQHGEKVVPLPAKKR